ncbi:unnamed protein product [Chrysoparadoxa australica]
MVQGKGAVYTAMARGGTSFLLSLCVGFVGARFAGGSSHWHPAMDLVAHAAFLCLLQQQCLDLVCLALPLMAFDGVWVQPSCMHPLLSKSFREFWRRHNRSTGTSLKRLVYDRVRAACESEEQVKGQASEMDGQRAPLLGVVLGVVALFFTNYAIHATLLQVTFTGGAAWALWLPIFTFTGTATLAQVAAEACWGMKGGSLQLLWYALWLLSVFLFVPMLLSTAELPGHLDKHSTLMGDFLGYVNWHL